VSKQGERVAGVKAASSSGGRANNGMHPTANSVAFIRETPAIQRFVAAGDAGR
jgi:hypothetical protein